MCDADAYSFLCESADSDVFYGKKCVPTQTQIREQMGSLLSNVFFENLGSEARTLLGLDPPLVGPDTIWVDPESRLKEKVVVTTVPEPSSIRLKATTHGSILEVGRRHIEMLENRHRQEMEEALRKQEMELEEVCEGRCAMEIAAAGVEPDGNCKKVVATLMHHFDECFNEMVETCKLRMRKECRMRVEQEREEVAAYMLTVLQDEVERRDLELCSDFHDVLYSELNTLACRYNHKMNEERKIAIKVLQETIRKYEKMLKDIKLEMELCGTVDICQAITQERVAGRNRIKEKDAEVRGKVEELMNYVEELETQNSTLKQMATERLKRLNQWRKKVQIILQEFQKFINFSLKAVPGQSEFLLSMEKLLLKKYPEDNFLSPEDYGNYLSCVKGKLAESDEDQILEEKYLEKSVSNEEGETSQETGECYQSTRYQKKSQSNLVFDYDQFKSMLVRKFADNINKEKPMKKTIKKSVCKWKKKSKEVPIDTKNELYQILTVVGEWEKEHIAPVSCFLKNRLKAILQICEDDPEFAKVILGCTD